MIQSTTCVALVPLRGGSKSIPKKNIKHIAGKPLCAWSLEAAARSEAISAVFVSTDSDEIASTVKALGLDIGIVWRPPELATDDASTEAVMLHFSESIAFDALVTIQATSPLLTPQDLDAALELFRADQLDSLLSAVRTKRFFWSDGANPLNYDPTRRPRRQEFRGTLMENGAFYLTRRTILERHRCRLGGKIGIFEMDESTSMEVDEPEDWLRVERLLLERIAATNSI